MPVSDSVLRPSPTTPEIVLQGTGIRKEYGHVQALRGVDFDVRPAEIVALVGDNGAGKSTLVKILSGAIRPTSGSISVDGAPVRFSGAADARALGVETVYQDLALAPDLDVPSNFFLGREARRTGLLGRIGFLDQGTMRRQTQEALHDLGVTIENQSDPVVAMSGGQRQGIAVARAAVWARKVIFLDEPTAALGVQQSRQVANLIRRIRDDRGVAVVLISHNMEQVLELSDRVHVLRLGESVATFETRDTDPQQLVAAITGLYRQMPAEG